MRLKKIISVLLVFVFMCSNLTWAQEQYLATTSLFARLSSIAELDAHIIAVSVQLGRLLDLKTTEPESIGISKAIQGELRRINDILGDNKIKIKKDSAVINPDGSVEFVVEYKEGFRPDQVAFKYTAAGELEKSGDSRYIEALLARAAEAEGQRRIEYDNLTKGEHVDRPFLSDVVNSLPDSSKRPINDYPGYNAFIQRAIKFWKGEDTKMGRVLETAFRLKKIIVVDIPVEKAGSPWTMYVRFYRRMRYTFIYTMGDNMYIPKQLLDVFLNPERMEAELKEYVGETEYARLLQGKTLEERLIGALGHDAYESVVASESGPEFDRTLAHHDANRREALAAGESKVSPGDETGFDDIAKLLVMKSLGMVPSIELFDILRDHTKNYDKEEKEPFGYKLIELQSLKSKNVIRKLEIFFEERTGKRDRYYLLSHRNGEHDHVIAIVKRKKDGTEIIRPIFTGVVPAYKLSVTTLIDDYKFFKAQKSVPKEDRLFLAFVNEQFTEAGKDDVGLVGGKGASLAEMAARKVPVPAGVVAAVMAYKRFLDANPDLKEFLRKRMATLDVKDNTARGRLAREIAERMRKAVIPDEVVKELEIYYRHLNILKGNTNYDTPVADRTSGVLEDIAAQLAWFKRTTGSQAGQGDTYLNVKGIENVKEKLRDCWVSLFTDRAISYRDDQWFIMLAERLGEAGYNDLIKRLYDGGYKAIADTMTNFDSPGYLNLRNTVAKLPDAGEYARAIDETAKIFITPEELGIAVVVMNMIKSYWSGVAFTVNATTGFAAKDLAKRLAKLGDTRFVRLDKVGNIVGTRPMVVQIESNWRYGETVVGGKVTPDKVVLATLDGEDWFILDRDLGTKIYQMVDIEIGFQLLSDQMNEPRVRTMAPLVGDLVRYAENHIHIARLIKTDDNLMKRLKNPSTDRKQNEQRIVKLAKDIAPLAEKNDRDGIRTRLAQDFSGDLDSVVSDILRLIEGNREAAERGHLALKTNLATTDEVINKFREMILGVWENKDLNEIKDKEQVLRFLKLDLQHFRIMTWLFRSIIDGTFTVILDTPEALRKKFTFPDKSIIEVARLAYRIGDHYEDDRDIEFAVEEDENGEIKSVIYDVEGREVTREGLLKLFNVQARPYTAKVVDTDVRRDVFVVNPDFIEKNKVEPIASGAKGESAARGMIYVVDDTRDLGEQADEIRQIMAEKGWKRENGEGVIALIKFATPAHDPIMKIAAATITYEGGETSHAAIFNREQGNPCVAGIGRPKARAQDILQHGNFIVVDANEGKIYEDKEYDGKKIPVERETIIIKPYIIPREEGDPKSGMILAGTSMAQMVSPLTGWGGHYGNSLSRMEFGVQAMGIYPTAAIAYDNQIAILNGEKTIDGLSEQERRDLEELRRHPDVIEAIREKISGFPTASEYVISKMEYIYNTLGISLSPDQWDIARDYDNKENEVIGELIGAELYVHPGENPLIELRGSSLMVRPESQKPFGLLLEGFLRSIKNGLDNHGWMYVFVRTERELNQLLTQLDEITARLDVKIKNVGIMVEVPSNAFIIDRLAGQLVAYRERHPGVKTFFSFGTNDYTNLAGKTDRDDKAVQELQVMDPDIKEVTFSDGSSYVRTDKGRLIIPLADEGSPVVQQLIETVVAEAIKKDISCGLCGQAIVKLIEYKNYLGAARIIGVLNSFGTDIKNYVMANMVRYDAMARTKRISTDVQVTELFPLTETTQDSGVAVGEIVFVDKPEDLVSDELKGLPEDQKAERIRFLRDNDPAKLSRIGNKIVVITKNFGSREELRKAGIEYVDLQYARAIIVEEGVDISGWDLFDEKLERVIHSRFKGKARNLSNLRSALEGQTVTIDYTGKRVLRGIVPVEVERPVPQPLNIPEVEATVQATASEVVSANDIFRSIGIHPLMLLAYDSKELDGDEFKKTIINNLKEEYKQKKIEKTDDDIVREAGEYIAGLKREIAGKIEGFPNAKEYLKAQFKKAMTDTVQKNQGKMVLYRTMNLTRRDFSGLKGGLIERVNENPGYGLLGAAREISDFWQVYRLELEALKEARSEGNNNLGLLISDLRGVRSGAVLNAHMQVLRDVGLVPGQDGLEVGVNIASASDVLSVEGYAGEGITFVVFEERPLAAALFGANLARQHEIGITEDEIKDIVIKPRKMVKVVVQDRGLKWVELPAPSVAVPPGLALMGGVPLDQVQAYARGTGASGREFPVPDDAAVEDQAEAREQSIFRMGRLAGYVNRVLDKLGSFFYLLYNAPQKTKSAVYAFRFEDIIADIRTEEITSDSLWEKVISERANTAIAKIAQYLKKSNPQAVLVVYSDKKELTVTRMEAALNAIEAAGVFSKVITGDETAVAKEMADKGTIVFATSREVIGYHTVKVSRATDNLHRSMVPFEEVVTVMTEILDVQPEGELGTEQKARILKGYKIWLQQAGFTADELATYLDELRRALDESSGLVVSLPIPPLPRAGSVIEELDREYLQKEISTYA